MCTQAVRLFLAFVVLACSLFALPAMASTMLSPDLAVAPESWADMDDSLSDDAVLEDHASPVSGEAQADPSGPPRADLAVLDTALLMAPPRVPDGTALRSRHPDGLQRPPCRAAFAA